MWSASNALFPLNGTTIYRMVMEETRWEAVSPGSEWSILFEDDYSGSPLHCLLALEALCDRNL
jgi:hypothetical protein